MVSTPTTLRLLDDQPEQVPEHLWTGLRDFADRLTTLLPDLPTGSPILVTGDWGSGKTTLLHAIKDRLDQECPGRSIWFEAWRHESEELLLPALVRAVWDASSRAAGDAAFRSAWHAAALVGLRAVRVVAALAGRSEVVDALGTPADWRGDRDAMAACFRPPEQDPVVLLHDALKNLIEQGWPQIEDPHHQPIIFIDDLDRCDPGRTVGFIEHVRAIVSRGAALPCRFVMAVDHHVLVRAIAGKFAVIGAYEGNRYLEKVFPNAFSLPAPDAKQVACLLEVLFMRMGFDRSGRHDYWREALTNALVEEGFANPRLMKLCINRFVMVQRFEWESPAEQPIRDDSERRIHDAVLARWLAATSRWPALRRLVGRPREQLDAIADRLHGTGHAALGSDVEGLMQEPGASAWLRQELFSRGQESVQRLRGFRQAEQRLRRWGL